MTEDEARVLLPMYADGILPPDEAKQVEAVVAQSPDLQAEVRKLKEENAEVHALLQEALAPLRPSRSARMRLSDAMLEVHRRAEHIADTMPERGWRIFRYAFALLALIAALLTLLYAPPQDPTKPETSWLFIVTVGVFMIGITFLLCGNILADLEARLLSALYSRDVEPTRLEVLTLEVFGIVSIVASSAFYFYLR
ncbi:MAG TPA: hypothetical protein VEK08_02400 [Planctomycetota bacterium]|nr:hypothetical protein [Planctomycetota bacterium]